MLIIYKKFQATTELGTTNYWDIEKNYYYTTIFQ